MARKFQGKPKKEVTRETTITETPEPSVTCTPKPPVTQTIEITGIDYEKLKET